MKNNDINNEYFEWLSDIVCSGRYVKGITYRKLLMFLHTIEFKYTISRDKNRANDGIDLRYRFSVSNGYTDIDIYKVIDMPCSVLEMIIALSIRCEENIMDNPVMGDRTKQWFWGMINSLGLGSMYDANFDRVFVSETIERFLNRDYSPDGKGGLFTIKRCKHDLRKVEIWTQLCWYLDSIIGG